jgi:hypothetical protein
VSLNWRRNPVLAKSAEVGKFIRRPRTQFALWRDYLRTRRSTAFLRGLESTPGGKRVLFISLSNSVYQMKLEAMLAAGLRMSGFRPAILVSSRAHTVGVRLFRAFGLSDFIYLDDIELTPAEGALCARMAPEYLEGPMTIQSVKQWMFRTAWIGPQILSQVARAKHLGTPDPANPEVREGIKKLLPSVLERVIQAEKLYSRYMPDVAVANEANYATFGPFVDTLIAKGIDVIALQQPWRDDALIFKRLNHVTRRIHPASVTPGTFARFASAPLTDKANAALENILADRYSGKWVLQARNQSGTRPVARAELVDKLGLDPSKKIAVVFSHILWDANLFYGDDLFEDYGDWFVQTVKAACANPSVNWLIKLHPANLWKLSADQKTGELAEHVLIREKIGSLPKHVRVLDPSTDVSTASLFEIADYGITVRGTAGVELPCFGVPTFTAGTGRYSGLGFTIDSSAPEEYLARLKTLPEAAEMTDAMIARARWHALLVFQIRQWPMRSFSPVIENDFSGRNPLAQNLEVVASSIDEVRRNRDLTGWTEWVASPEIDYLDQASLEVVLEGIR